MYTLFIDTHSNKIIIILYKDEEMIGKKEVATNNNHSITTMPILIELLEEKNMEVKELNEIIVVNGPGSFTGVRLGVTIAKTLAYTLKIPIKTMSSLLIKAVSFSHEKVKIVEEEKNGFFIGEFDKDNNLIGEYQYKTKAEFRESQEETIGDIPYDYSKIINFAKTISPMNPHAVNPLYVKKIEVQK